jgi:hypothetical protein
LEEILLYTVMKFLTQLHAENDLNAFIMLYSNGEGTIKYLAFLNLSDFSPGLSVNRVFFCEIFLSNSWVVNV